MSQASVNTSSVAHDLLDDWAWRLIHCKVDELIGRYGLLEADREDLQQELGLQILLSAPRFDPARAKKKAFTRRVVNNKIAALLRHRKRTKRQERQRTSLSAVEHTASGEVQELGEAISADRHAAYRGYYSTCPAEAFDRSQDVAHVLASLPDDLRAVAEKLQHDSKAEVQRKLGLSKHAMAEVLQQLRARFAAAGLEDDGKDFRPTRLDLA
jgi:DNA-directed RNA polymerase specialized sigma24 family protein